MGARQIDVAKRLSDASRFYKSPLYRRNIGNEEPMVEQMLGLQSGEGLKKEDNIITAEGTIKEKLQETYQGVPVSGNEVVLEQGLDGDYIGATGHLIEGIEEDIHNITDSVSKFDAFLRACAFAGYDPYDDCISFDEDSDAKLEIIGPDTLMETVKLNLVYQLGFHYECQGRASRPMFTIDAKTGEVLDMWEGITSINWRNAVAKVKEWMGFTLERERKATEININDTRDDIVPGDVGKPFLVTGHGGNKKTGRYTFGKEYGKLNVWRNGDTCSMENDFVKVFNMNGTRTVNDTYTFPCDIGIDDIDTKHGSFSQINDAFYFSNAAHDMFMEWLKVPPLKSKIVARVHFGKNFENAFWDGKVTTYGDGDKRFWPLAFKEIIAHEIGHGFTEQHSGLIYTGHSGGINEAFSDIAGAALTAYLNETEWSTGLHISKSGKPLRYLKKPPLDGKSVDHYSSYCPGIDVHYSSGIFNKAFYYLTHKPNWNIRKAFEVFGLANRMYWTKKSSFQSAACGAVSAAKDLGYDGISVADSFRKVGVVPCGSKTGFDAANDISISAGDRFSLTFVLNVPVPKLKIEALGTRFWTAGNDSNAETHLTVKHGSYIYEETNETSMVIIENAAAGPYEVSLEATDEDAYKWSVSASVSRKDLDLSGLTFLLQNETSIYNETANSTHKYMMASTTFTFPEDVIDSKTSVSLRVKAKNETNVRHYMNHESPVKWEDDDNPEYKSSEKMFGNDTITDIIICDPKPGVYYIYIKAFGTEEKPEGLEMWYEQLLAPSDINTKYIP